MHSGNHFKIRKFELNYLRTELDRWLFGWLSSECGAKRKLGAWFSARCIIWRYIECIAAVLFANANPSQPKPSSQVDKQSGGSAVGRLGGWAVGQSSCPW